MPKKPTTRQLKMAATRKRLSTEAHLQMSVEDWRTRKRQQWRVILNAVDLFTYGSAYTPVGADLYEMTKAMNRISVEMEDDWVCW